MHEYATEIKSVLDQLDAGKKALADAPNLASQIADLQSKLDAANAEIAKRLPVDDEDAAQLA